VQLLQDAREPCVVLAVEVQLAQFRHRLEPETFVFGVAQRVQGCLVKVLQKLHLPRSRDVIKDRVDRLLGVVSRHSRFDVGQELLVPGHHLYEVLKAKVNLDHLLQRFKAPFA
jgi:hypothetical protein